ncbi:VWA domain-containing protein [Flavobacterium sp. W21_SRS_FM6]|uniref:VWA domain-containing protein n=1 Tax=Flavobacterium sp. W21_SRS_FM6 TaxID=3240268 RepID=UPI003F90A6C3
MSEFLLQLQDFHFLRIQWLWALVPLFIIAILLAYFSKQQTGWQSVLAGHLYKHLVSHGTQKSHKYPFGLLVLGWLLATLALAGPTWERLPQPVFQLNTGKVVLMDMSMSMRATDIKPNRLTRAKYKAIDLVKKLTEGETGLVAYAGDAFTISPLSSDGQNLTALIPSLSPEIMPIPGSDPVLGLQTAFDLLKSANYQQGDIFWITDGVDNRQLKEISDLLNKSSYRLSILAVGTEEGAPVQTLNGELLKDSNGAIVIPKLPTSNLQTLAKQGGGRYAPLQSDDSDIDYLMNQTLLDNNAGEQESAGDDNFGDKWQELGPYLLLLLLPLAAYSFRKGLIPVFLIAFALPMYAPQAEAGWWQDMWKTKDQQGLEAFHAKEFKHAAETFEDPLWAGSSLYKDENYEQALKAFSQIDSIDGRYNQANTLAQLGKYPEAIALYKEVLAEQADHQDALANKTFLEKLLEQQEQQQQDQQNEQSDQQNDPQQNQDGDNSEQDQDQQNQQNQDSDQQSQPQDSEQQNQDQASDKQESQDSKAEQENTKAQNSNTKGSQTDSKEPEQQQAQPSESEQEPENPSQEAQQQAMAEQTKELTDEEKEQMQRMQTLLNRVPDDPAFLLKRKMQIEAQQRKRERVPSNLERNW